MYTALIVAAGLGKRMKTGQNKMFVLIKDKPLIYHTAHLFADDDDCEDIIVVCQNEETKDMRKALQGIGCRFVTGGETRQDSVRNGLVEVSSDRVMIHDGARPNVGSEALSRLKEKLSENKAAALCVRPKDSVSLAKNGLIDTYVDRDALRLMQTPQAFMTADILTAHRRAKEENMRFTDDVSLYRAYTKKKVFVVEGNYDNIKVTDPSDLKYMEELL